MLKNIIVVILAIISTIGINLNLDKNLNFIESLTGNDISYILIFLAFTFLIYKAFQNKDRRLEIISFILGFLFGIFEILGHSIVNYGDFSGILYSKEILFKNIFKFIYYVTIVYSLIKVLFKYFANLQVIKEKKNCKFFTNNKRSIISVMIILFVLWLPYFLLHYPGILGVDSCNQLEQATGLINISSHHPVFLTLMIRLFINMTNPIFNNMTISVAICIIVKMLVIALSISIAIYYLAKKNVNIGIRFLILMFFAINPVIPLYAISLDKDSLFASILLIDVILLFEFITNTDNFIKSKLKIFTSFICILLTVLIRNNGLYIYILIIPFIYIFLKKKYVKLSIFFVSTLISIYLINTIIFGIFNVGESSSVEMLSIPFQAMARMAKYNDNNLADKEKEEIDLFINYDRLGQAYNPNLSDPIKGLFKESYFQEHKLQFVTLNVKLFINHPTYYIESILCNTSGYWYPENRKLMFERGVVENKFEIENKSLISGNSILQELDWGPEKREIPVIGMLYSSGFCFWMLLVIIFYTIYRKKYSLLIAQLPLILNYLTIIAGPSNNEFRYILPIYICIPILYSLVINDHYSVQHRDSSSKC